MNDTEYNVILNKPDLDTYEYEIWKRANRKMSFVTIVRLSLDEFKEYLLIYNRVVDKMKVVYPFYESVIIKKPKKVNV